MSYFWYECKFNFWNCRFVNILHPHTHTPPTPPTYTHLHTHTQPPSYAHTLIHTHATPFPLFKFFHLYIWSHLCNSFLRHCVHHTAINQFIFVKVKPLLSTYKPHHNFNKSRYYSNLNFGLSGFHNTITDSHQLSQMFKLFASYVIISIRYQNHMECSILIS